MEIEKNLEISVLLDFYKDLLTEKQFDAMDLYFNNDMSLAEIASDLGITRQGVRDFIKRGEQMILSTEEKLGYAKRYRRNLELSARIKADAEQMVRVSRDIGYGPKMESLYIDIIQAAEELND